MRALTAEPLDALHFAGHAYFVSSNPAHGGLVCANDEVLRGSDLDGQSDLPALVFFNACEAARVRRRAHVRSSPPRLQSRPVSVAEAFLAGGVANFIGTHWPVGDAAASLFSTSLYSRLVGGDDLGAAILASRRLLHARELADWADYVHYGNPAFVPLASRNDRQ